MTDQRATLKEILLPADRDVSLRVLIFVVALLLLAFVTQGFIWMTSTLLDGIVTASSRVVLFLCAVSILGASVNGYANDDLLTSVLVAVAPVIGFGLFAIPVSLIGTVPGVSDAGRTALVRGGATAILGSAAGLAGVWIGRRYGTGRSAS